MKKQITIIKYVAVTVMAITMVACGGKLSGTYDCGYGQKVVFEGGKMKTVMSIGGAVETPYDLDGKEVKVEQHNVTATLYTLDENGCLVGAGGLARCCKKSDEQHETAGKDESEVKPATSDKQVDPTVQADADNAAARAKFVADSIAAAISNASGQ